MIVPPYVPDALEVDGNVAGERYTVRLRFLRQVVALHYATVILIAGLAAAPMPRPPVGVSAALLIFSLLALSVTRQLTKPRSVDQIYSSVLAPVLFVSLAFVAAALVERGFPAWSPVVGLTCGLLYTMLCGRDFSFVWLWIIGAGVSSAILVASAYAQPWPVPALAEALLLNAGYLLYFVYDLACLQSRRRKSEVPGAVIDLYRDVLNVITYSVRVVRHWRRYRIWAPK